MIAQKPIIDDELVVAEKFINYINKKENKDFIIPFHPDDSAFDAESYSKSNPKKKLKMEIVKSDFGAHKELGRKGKYIKFRNAEEKIQEIIIKPVIHKSRKNKYSPDFKKDNILLIDGWWTLYEDELNHFKDKYLNSYEFLEKAGFKEIWFIGMKDDGPVYKLYP